MIDRRIFPALAIVLLLAAGICGVIFIRPVPAASGTGGTEPGEASPTVDRDVIFQVGTFDALLKSNFEGSYTAGNLTREGDLGIGTLDALDGELILLDGTVYDVKSDGIAYVVPADTTVPFATVTFFEPDITFTEPDAGNLSALTRDIGAKLPTENHFYAVKITGTFPKVTARSVPRQEKPYPNLTAAVANQSVFEFRNVTGTVVGFITPEYVQGINVPGYHLHFLTENRTRGGHLLDLTVRNATVELDTTSRFAMVLPEEGSFTTLRLGGDISADTAFVEQGGATTGAAGNGSGKA